MRMWKHDEFLDPLLLALLSLVTFFSGELWSCQAASFGINYGKIANNLPAPAEVVDLIQSLEITKSKLYDADPMVLTTFGNTGISFIVGIANEELAALNNEAVAMDWVAENVARHLPATRIVGLVVGNEIFGGTDTSLMAQVLPAMRNVRKAVSARGLDGEIFVSTAHSFSTLGTSFPPSAGAFAPAIASAYMEPVLQFLAEARAPFLINAYPFFAYKASPASVPLDYVLFRPNAGVVDPATGLRYHNMFDAQMDAVYSAIAKLGVPDLPLLVSETGWPSAGDVDEPGATVDNARQYHSQLVAHLASTRGTTPLRPNASLDVYLFALFNEDMKPGPTSERNYGLFRPDCTKVYDFDFDPPSSSSSAYSYSPYFSSSAPPPPFTILPYLLLSSSLLLLLSRLHSLL